MVIQKKHMSINYYKKNVYGKNTLYIDDTNTAKIISRLTGQKTLTDNTINCLKELGFTFNQVLN